MTHNADVEHGLRDGSNPLVIATFRGHVDVVRELLIYKANVDHRGTPLYIAARSDKFDLAELLLQFGARKDIASDDGDTPLAIALKKNHLTIADLLN